MNVFELLIAFQLKHFIADYPLQTQYMLGKFKAKGWVEPLAAHAGVHAVLTAMLASIAGVAPLHSLGLAFCDFCIHFAMDRIKADPDLLGRFKALSGDEYKELQKQKYWWHPATAFFARRKLRGNTLFWYSLGLDQMVHHLTHYAIIYAIMQLV